MEILADSVAFLSECHPVFNPTYPLNLRWNWLKSVMSAEKIFIIQRNSLKFEWRRCFDFFSAKFRRRQIWQKYVDVISKFSFQSAKYQIFEVKFRELDWQDCIINSRKTTEPEQLFSGQRIVVLGSNLAGLTAAYELQRKGAGGYSNRKG